MHQVAPGLGHTVSKLPREWQAVAGSEDALGAVGMKAKQACARPYRHRARCERYLSMHFSSASCERECVFKNEQRK